MAVMEMAGEVADKTLFAANMRAFALYMPEQYEVLKSYRAQTELVRNPDGSCDIDFRGQRLYDTQGTGITGPELARREIDKMRGTGRHRLFLAPLSGRTLDDHAGLHLGRMLKRGVDAGLQFNSSPTVDDAYHLIVFGLGLGYHLERLIALTRPQSICIVEPNLDFLHHSLFTFDWTPVLMRRHEWSHSVSIIGDNPAGEMARKVRWHCRNANPAALDSAVVFQSYENYVMSAAEALFRKDAHLIQMGLGFFNDELEMLRASYFNLVAGGNQRMFRRSQAPLDLPAFIVGSGPSIDENLDFLRENQGRAAIFSCGTALGVLLANGIRPDFQLILENGEEPRLAMETVARTHSLDGIVLLGSNTISPQSRELFGETVYFMRPSLCPFPLLSPGREYSLDEPGPTVTNTGLSAAIALGFKRIFLFGTDLGVRSPERHHSRFSPYRMAERATSYADGAEIEIDAKYPTRLIGNFGGIVLTNDLLTWSRDSMEKVIASARGAISIFNCSDGIIIKGARAKESSSVKLPDPEGGKAKVVRRLMDWFPPAASFDFPERWRSVSRTSRIRRFADRLIERVKQPHENFGALLHEMCQLLIPDHRRMPTFEEYCLRGSAFIGLIASDYYVRRVLPPEDRERFMEMADESWVEMIERVVRCADLFFAELDELRNGADLQKRLKEWMA